MVFSGAYRLLNDIRIIQLNMFVFVNTTKISCFLRYNRKKLYFKIIIYNFSTYSIIVVSDGEAFRLLEVVFFDLE